MMTFTARSDGKVLVPEEPVELLTGTRYRVSVKPFAEAADDELHPLREFARKYGGKAKGNYPADLAKNHDHYLHGTPKR
jgi:hypothetical protein